MGSGQGMLGGAGWQGWAGDGHAVEPGGASCFSPPQGDRGFDGQPGPKGSQGQKGERVS